MIREECIVTIWRFSDEASNASHPDFQGACNVFYITNTVICVKGLVAQMTRANQREFLEMCSVKGIKYIYADRAPGRSLPMARRQNDHLVISIEELMDRVSSMEKPKVVPENSLRRRSSDLAA